MKKIALIMCFVATAIMFSGCAEEEKYYLENSHWILHVDGMTEGHRLALTFDGETLTSADGDSHTPPFSGTETWFYYITGDSQLYIYQYETDSDGGTYTESHTLTIDVDDAMSYLTLYYKPAFGSTRTYRFDRR